MHLDLIRRTVLNHRRLCWTWRFRWLMLWEWSLHLLVIWLCLRRIRRNGLGTFPSLTPVQVSPGAAKTTTMTMVIIKLAQFLPQAAALSLPVLIFTRLISNQVNPAKKCFSTPWSRSILTKFISLTFKTPLTSSGCLSLPLTNINLSLISASTISSRQVRSLLGSQSLILLSLSHPQRLKALITRIRSLCLLVMNSFTLLAHQQFIKTYQKFLAYSLAKTGPTWSHLSWEFTHLEF